jgi:hypothetical protein
MDNMDTHPDTWHALAIDLDAGRVREDDDATVWLDLGGDGRADVSTLAWAMYRAGLAEVGADGRGWKLTAAGEQLLPQEVAGA